MEYNFKRGVTLVELIMVIVILGVLSASGTPLMFHLMKNSVFVPNKLNMDMLAGDALDIMIDGDSRSGGLHFSRAVSAIQDYQVTFIDQDGRSVTYRMDTGAQKLYRSINAGAEAPIPYYASSPGIYLEGKNGKLFTYYDVNEAVTADPAAVRRIALTLSARTGSGSYANWQARSEQSTSIAVKKYQ